MIRNHSFCSRLCLFVVVAGLPARSPQNIGLNIGLAQWTYRSWYRAKIGPNQKYRDSEKVLAHYNGLYFVLCINNPKFFCMKTYQVCIQKWEKSLAIGKSGLRFHLRFQFYETKKYSFLPLLWVPTALTKYFSMTFPWPFFNFPWPSLFSILHSWSLSENVKANFLHQWLIS